MSTAVFTALFVPDPPGLRPPSLRELPGLVPVDPEPPEASSPMITPDTTATTTTVNHRRRLRWCWRASSMRASGLRGVPSWASGSTATSASVPP